MKRQKSKNQKPNGKDFYNYSWNLNDKILKNWPSFEQMRLKIMGDAKQEQVRLLYSLNCKQDAVARVNSNNYKQLIWTNQQDLFALYFYFDRQHQQKIEKVLQNKTSQQILARYQFLNLQINSQIKQAIAKNQLIMRNKKSCLQVAVE